MADTNIAKELLDAWNAVAEKLDASQKDQLREWIGPLIWQWGFMTPAERANAIEQLKQYVRDLVTKGEVPLPWIKSAVDIVAEKRKKMILTYGLAAIGIFTLGVGAYYLGTRR